MVEDPEPVAALVGATLDGRYRLEAFVAHGGYGAVYRSTHDALGCPVAIKVLTAPAYLDGGAPGQFVEAFEREARIVAALHHPAIVRIFDVGVATLEGHARPYIVLEWVEGETLERRLAASRGARRSPREAFELLHLVFDAIASAHEAGVVHRDLKPSNVMVTTPRRGAAVTRVLDFGIAKILGPERDAPDWTERTEEASPTFSLSHAAPEQIGRLRTGPWTDVHALALLLVEVLVGERAYRGATSIEVFASISARRRPTPATFGVDVGPWEALLDRALSLVPGDRPGSASVLLASLEATLDEAQRAWEAGAVASAEARPSDAPRSPARTRRAWRARVAVASVLAASGLAAVAALWGAQGRAGPRAEPRPAALQVATVAPAALVAPPTLVATADRGLPPAPATSAVAVAAPAPRPRRAVPTVRPVDRARELAIE